MSFGPGSVVASRFRLEDLLVEHDGARLWRAVDLVLARNVALHVIPADDPRAPAVLTAARTSALVSDGHLLRVLDALEEDGLVHVVHEWGSGTSLDRMVAEQTLEPRRAAWLVREVAEAISVAHAQGIAHGRLVPENVLVSESGSVKLIGFVVDAVLHGRRPRADDAEEPPSEHESDVLNLGALLYAGLTGTWPGFPRSVLPDAPTDHGRLCRPRQVKPGVPKALDQLCHDILGDAGHGTRARGARRYETAAAVGAALGDYLGDTLSSAALPLSGPTAFLDPAGLQAPQTAGTLGSFDGVPSSAPLGPAAVYGDPEATQAGPAPGLADTGETTGAFTPPVAARLPSTVAAAPLPPAGRALHRSASYGGAPRERDEDRPGATWLRLAALIAAVAVVLVAVVVGYGLMRPGDTAGGTADPTPTGEATPEPAGTPVTAVSVVSFDPAASGGNGDENPELVALATDGDPATAWETLTYFDGPRLPPYKDGVGLLLDLGEDTSVGEVAVSLVGSPYTLALLAGPEGLASAPAAPGELRRVASLREGSGEVVLRPAEPVTTRWLVVWLVALPPVEGGFRGEVAEVVVRS